MASGTQASTHPPRFVRKIHRRGAENAETDWRHGARSDILPSLRLCGESLRRVRCPEAGDWWQPAGQRGRVGPEPQLAYLSPVKTLLTILVALLMFATLGVLFAGFFGLVRGGGNPARSNQLMRWRVILQAGALLLFALLMTLLRA